MKPSSSCVITEAIMDEFISAPLGLPQAMMVSDEDVLGGMLVVAGTRVPALTILAYLRAGHSDTEIIEDYPSLCCAGIRAVEDWAAEQFGALWKMEGSRALD